MFEKNLPEELETLIYKKLHNMYMVNLQHEIKQVNPFFWKHYFARYNFENDTNLNLFYDHEDFWNEVDLHYRAHYLNANE